MESQAAFYPSALRARGVLSSQSGPVGGWAGGCQTCGTHISVTRVGFLPEEMYFFQDARKKLENSYFFQFLPEETGRNGRNRKQLKYGIPKL